MLVSERDNFGTIELRINEILREKHISKNRICKEMDIPRANFNRYCRNDFQRIDANLICKLCFYLEVDVGDLIVYKRPQEETNG
ncbi:MAG: helix-turn-helix transcriptional regulator [Clostridia bacterium]|nr:helix-turn-helix transcriptional regulator [Clostridia bacterium]